MSWHFTAFSSSWSPSWSGHLRLRVDNVGFEKARISGLLVLAIFGAIFTLLSGSVVEHGLVAGYFAAVVGYHLITVPFGGSATDEILLVIAVYAIGAQLGAAFYWKYVAFWMYAVVYSYVLADRMSN